MSSTPWRLTLLISSLLWGAALAHLAAEEARAPAEPTPEAQRLEARFQALERRVQMLEQSVVEKDARIAELQKKLEAAQQQLQARPAVPGQPEFPGFRFELRPQDMAEIEKQMKKLFENPDGFFGPDAQVEPELPNLEGRRRPRADDLAPQELMPLRRPRLGVEVAAATAELREQYKNPAQQGAFVLAVTPGSPAEKAGILAGDCITSFDGTVIRGPQELHDATRAAEVGKRPVVLLRRGEEIVLQVVLEKAAERAPRFKRPLREAPDLPPPERQAPREGPREGLEF